MTYLATLTLDYNATQHNEYQRLQNALSQCGWDYAETSALVYEADSLDGFVLALEVLARAIETAGDLTALALQVQLVGPARLPPAQQNHRRALERLLAEPLPSSYL